MLSEYKKYIKTIMEAFFVTWAMVKICSISVANIFSLVFFSFAILVIKLATASKDSLTKDKKIGIGVLSALFVLMYTLVDYYNWVSMLENKMFKLIILLAVMIGLFILFYDLLSIIFVKLNEYRLNNKNTKDDIRPRVLLSTAILCFLAYFPYFLYLYPAVMTPDSVNQLEQALGMINYSNHHPWVHTLFIKLCFNIGYKISGDRNFAIATYTLLQMLISSVAAGYIVDTIKTITQKKWLVILSALYFAFVPYNAVFAVTMWKDIIFSYGVLVMMCALLKIIRLQENVKKSEYIIFTISSLVMCLFRTNGFPAYLITGVLIIIYFRKKLVPMGIIVICVVIAALIVKKPIMNSYNVKQPDFTESIAIPAQMMARVLVSDRRLNDDDMYEIEHVVDLTYIKELYVPDYGDNIKELIRAGHPEYLEKNKFKFFKIFIRNGFNYPLDYLHAYIDVTRGYWYPDNDITIAETEGIPDNSCGVYSTPLLRGKLIVKAKEILLKLGTMLPVYGALWCLGAGFWFTLFTFAFLLTHENKQYYIVVIPIIMLMGTLFIASPISGVFRYAYFMMLSIPLFAGLILMKE